MPSAPITMTHGGIEMACVKSPDCDAWTMAARGPTAFATSLAPCAKHSNAAETTSGIPNKILSDLLRFSSPSDCFLITGIMMAQIAMPIAAPIISDVVMSILMIFFRPFRAR